MVAAELLQSEAKLDASQFGRPIVYNISLASFRHSRDDWVKSQSKNDKVKKLFADIV